MAPGEIESARRGLPGYLKIANYKRLYFKNGRVVGAILANRYDPHPLLKVPTLHVGYIGYDAGLVTREEAQWLKREWIGQLATWNTDGRLLSATIDWFNNRSLALAEKCGLKIKFLRVEPRQ